MEEIEMKMRQSLWHIPNSQVIWCGDNSLLKLKKKKKKEPEDACDTMMPHVLEIYLQARQV